MSEPLNESVVAEFVDLLRAGRTVKLRRSPFGLSILVDDAGNGTERVRVPYDRSREFVEALRRVEGMAA